MIRIIVAGLGLMLLALLFVRVVKELRGLDLDWTGITFCLGFVALAFYLRFATGMG